MNDRVESRTQSLTNMVRLDLSRYYPVSMRLALRKSLVLAVCLGAPYAVLMLVYFNNPFLQAKTPWILQARPLAALCLTIWALKLLYEGALLKSHFYAIKGGALIVRSGLISRQLSSVRLARVVQVTLQDSLIDRLLGLKTLHIFGVPARRSARTVHIVGLRTETAARLRDHLIALIEASAGAVRYADQEYPHLRDESLHINDTLSGRVFELLQPARKSHRQEEDHCESQTASA